MIGYARVSTRGGGGQSLDSQVDAVVSAGAVCVFQEYASGATQTRARLMECLDSLQPGNVLTVADLTRLGRRYGGPGRHSDGAGPAGDRVPFPSGAVA
ncbi:recombinase family protein [Arthrobacter sp. YAF16]